MSEQNDVIGELRETGVIDGIRWAYGSAVARTMDLYSEEDGHGAATLGTLKFTHFQDRLDRVFSCGRYDVGEGEADANLDVLYANLSDRDIASMPRLDPYLVKRSDLNGSPGWVFGSYRFLLASAIYGKVDQIPWPQKSLIKQKVAQQRDPEPPPTLFDVLNPEEVGGLQELEDPNELDLRTFVIGHSLDPVSQQTELVFGRSRIAAKGESSWRWSEDILALPPMGGGQRIDDAPSSGGPDAEADAPVRLRRAASEKKRAEGEK
ncbi:hypothetical protein [Kocuria marina]|uniref:hypothetical protein n=1 Tax=Kocuria marina TaxID=223184 RepID=UPI0011A72EAA|nr:hypothetical protein [Kocuria indica]